MKLLLTKAVFVLASTLFFLVTSFNGALAWTVSGTVYAGSSVLLGATVKLTDTATTTQVGISSSNAEGVYSFSVSDGSYNLSITPPEESGFSESVVNGINVVGANVTQNVVLIKDALRLSGVVYGAGEVPLPNVKVVLFPKSGSNALASTITDSQGRYTFGVSPGDYKFNLEHYGTAWGGVTIPTAEPSTFWRIFDIGSVTVTGGTVYDLRLPFVRLSGKTTGSDGVSVGNITIKHLLQSTSWTDSNGVTQYPYTDGISEGASDAQGNYSIVITSGTASIALTPPDGSSLPLTIMPINISINSIQNLVLQSSGNLTGVVYGAGGIPVPNVSINIKSRNDSSVNVVLRSDAEGQYRVVIPPGEYGFSLEHYGAAWGGVTIPTAEPSTFWRIFGLGSVTVTGTTTYDINLPFAKLSGKTTDAYGAPVGDIKIRQVLQSVSWIDGNGVMQSPYIDGASEVTSDAQGNYSIVITSGTASVTLSPPTGSSLPLTIVPINILSNTIQDLVLLSTGNLAGAIYGAGGVPLPNVSINIKSRNDSSVNADLKSDAAGKYMAVIPPGEYDVNLEHYGAPWGGVTIPTFEPSTYWRVFGIGPLMVTGNTVYNVRLPFVNLSGKTTDINGVPVSKVKILTTLNPISWRDANDVVQSPHIDGGAEALSDTHGEYTLTVTKGADQIAISPPAESGFALTNVTDLNISSEMRLNAILPFVDTTLPIILSGPAVSGVTDSTATIEWQTNEPAKGGVVYGTTNSLDISVAEQTYKTDHSLPVIGLTPNTTYYIQVAASDAANNGPTTSQVISFTTRPTPDTAPPVVLTGPTITNITHSGAMVEWTTNEPSTGSVVYGLTGEPDQAVLDTALATTHRVTLTGLSTETIYYLKTAAKDAVNNGPTSTPVISFRTVAAPDTSAPVILEGPMAINISNSGATIIWKTDEPATSGVSWNDGTVYGVLSDDSLNTSHSVRLTGLTASTQYNFTVSSKDTFSNGPTLSTAAIFTTLPVPDTKPPVIILQPVVKNVNHQMALIYWETDEPTDSVIEYGTTATFGTADAQAELLTKHNRPLTGLLAGTTYYFRVLATDVSGNGPAVSQTYSFTTDVVPSTKAPVITKTPEVVYANEKAATVYFETDQPCDTVIEYGAGNRITNRQSDGEKVNKHQATITNLTPNTSYGVQVSCTGVEGQTVSTSVGKRIASLALGQVPNLAVTGFITGTISDTTSPIITATPTAISLTPNQATITWITDEISDSQVTYYLNGQQLAVTAGDIAQVFSHSIVLTNLTPVTSYQFTVLSVDPSGNQVTSSTYSFTTPLALDGSCGSAQGVAISVAPTTGLCSTGAASAVSGSNPWNWDCAGTDGGTTASCSTSTLQTWTITATVNGGNGSVTCTSPVSNSATSICEVMPATGYQLATFTDDAIDQKGSMVGANYSVANVTANHSIDATFTLIPVAPAAYDYEIANGNATLSCDGPVSRSSSQSCSTVNISYTCQITLGISADSPTTCRLVPASGSALSSVSGCSGTISGGIYITSTIPTATACTVSGKLSGTLAQFTIAATAGGGNGTISCTSPVYAGNTSTCIISPASGYVFSSLVDNAANVSSSVSNGSYTIGGGIFGSGVSSNHLVVATFVQAPLNGACGSNNGGTFTVAPTTDLCSTGTATAVTGSGTWTWSCAGEYAGTTAICNANRQVIATAKPGDCDNNGIVSIAEVQSAINMFLGLKSPQACVDSDDIGGVSIAEVQKVINSFLGL